MAVSHFRIELGLCRLSVCGASLGRSLFGKYLAERIEKLGWFERLGKPAFDFSFLDICLTPSERAEHE